VLAAEWALELRTELFQWWMSPTGRRFGAGWSAGRRSDAGIEDNIAHIEASKMSLAVPFYVTGEMTDLLIHAAKSFPETEFQAIDLPCPQGFVLLAKSVPTIDLHHKPLPWRAFSWMPYSHSRDAERERWAGSEDPESWRGIHLSLYAHRDDDPQRDDAVLEGLPDKHGTLSLVHETPWRFGTSHRTKDDFRGGMEDNKDIALSDEAFESGIQMLQTIHAFFLLVGQKIGTPEPMQATRGVRKRASRAMPVKEIPDVRIVTLRRYRDDGDHEVDPEMRGREYSHRFIVNAFWRRQWYPSEQRHKPKWIAPYVKGPKDKPLVIKDTAYLWRR
jgi:hypothetical protein